MPSTLLQRDPGTTGDLPLPAATQLGAALDAAVDAVMDLCRCCTAGLGPGPLPLSPALAELQERLDGSSLAATDDAPGPQAGDRTEVARRIDADIAAALEALARATTAGAQAGAAAGVGR